MKLVFIGPQGSGKGTQAKIISKKLGYCHLSAGDLLRDAKGEMGEQIKEILNKGELVPFEIICKMMEEEIKTPKCEKGFILDGFPRSMDQVNYFNNVTEFDKVFEIHISDDEAVRRLSGRKSCPKCNEIYNENTSPKPKVENTCDKCGVELLHREDDRPEAIRTRLGIYHQNTDPILASYNSIRVKIDGNQDIEKVTKDILKEIGE